MQSYLIHSKISWQEMVGDNWEEVFYPSLVKKIRKSDEYFTQTFDFSVNPLTEKEMQTFFDLYEKEIATRENYVYEKNEQLEILQRNITNGVSYALASFALKESSSFAGGMIFSLREKKYSIALRTFDRDIRSTYKSQTTIDFWAEKAFYEYTKDQGMGIITHGTDNYPNTGRIGLPLFKLKVGGRPRIAFKEHDMLTLSEDELLQKDEPTLFWDDPDENKFFKTCHLFHKNSNIDEFVLGELKKVLEWSNISLLQHSE